ncbi:MAG: PilZ domain-containing protein [Gammaproteobacteria bacterium]|nr:PilZ domain-containing protein [Gammaproteobacteria bacterium]
MSKLSDNIIEKRFSPRAAINGQIKYRLADESNLSSGILLNVSQTGALIGLKHKVPENTVLTILMESHLDDEPPVEISTKIIRTENDCEDHAYCYGCKIIDVKDF